MSDGIEGIFNYLLRRESSRPASACVKKGRVRLPSAPFYAENTILCSLSKMMVKILPFSSFIAYLLSLEFEKMKKCAIIIDALQ